MTSLSRILTVAIASLSCAAVGAPLAYVSNEGSGTELSRISAIDVDEASERPLRLGFSKGHWRINDRVFAMGETPIEVKRDTIETWLIRNYFNSMPHAMHLHGFHF